MTCPPKPEMSKKQFTPHQIIEKLQEAKMALSAILRDLSRF